MSSPLLVTPTIPVFAPDALHLGALQVPYPALQPLAEAALSAPGRIFRIDPPASAPLFVATLPGGIVLASRDGRSALFDTDALAEHLGRISSTRDSVARDLKEAEDSPQRRWALESREPEAQITSLEGPLPDEVPAGLHRSVAETALGQPTASMAEAQLGDIDPGDVGAVLLRVGAPDAVLELLSAHSELAGTSVGRALRAQAFAAQWRRQPDEPNREAAADALLSAMAQQAAPELELQLALAEVLTDGSRSERSEAMDLGREVLLAPDARPQQRQRAAAVLDRVGGMLRPETPRSMEVHRAFEAGQDDEVIRLGMALRAADAHTPHALIRTAMAFQRRGDLQDAVELLTEITAERPDMASAWINLLAFQLRASRKGRDPARLARAHDSATEAVRLHPSSFEVLGNAVHVFCDAGDLDAAEVAALRATRLRPGDATAAAWMEKVLALQADLPRGPLAPAEDFAVGARHLNAGDFARAIPFLTSAWHHLPDDPETGVALGQALRELYQVDEAVKVLASYTRLHPDRADGWGELGRARLALHEQTPSDLTLRQARRDLERALDLAPERTDYRLALADALKREAGDIAPAPAPPADGEKR